MSQAWEETSETDYMHHVLKKRGSILSHSVIFAYKLRATGLGGELSQPRGDRQTLFEQQAIEGVAAECLQIHLVLVIPELLQGVCTDCCRERDTQRDRGRKMSRI